jgi:polyadenylate-binding protein 2
MSASASAADTSNNINETNDAEEEDDEESLEKLQEEIARMEEEAARLSKETEESTLSSSANNKEAVGDASSASAVPTVTAAQQQKIEACSVYVGQVDYSTTPDELVAHFGPCGTIERVTIVCDKFTGKPKGELSNDVPVPVLTFHIVLNVIDCLMYF